MNIYDDFSTYNEDKGGGFLDFGLFPLLLGIAHVGLAMFAGGEKWRSYIQETGRTGLESFKRAENTFRYHRTFARNINYLIKRQKMGSKHFSRIRTNKPYIDISPAYKKTPQVDVVGYMADILRKPSTFYEEKLETIAKHQEIASKLFSESSAEVTARMIHSRSASAFSGIYRHRGYDLLRDITKLNEQFEKLYVLDVETITNKMTGKSSIVEASFLPYKAGKAFQSTPKAVYEYLDNIQSYIVLDELRELGKKYRGIAASAQDKSYRFIYKNIHYTDLMNLARIAGFANIDVSSKEALAKSEYFINATLRDIAFEHKGRLGTKALRKTKWKEIHQQVMQGIANIEQLYSTYKLGSNEAIDLKLRNINIVSKSNLQQIIRGIFDEKTLPKTGIIGYNIMFDVEELLDYAYGGDKRKYEKISGKLKSSVIDLYEVSSLLLKQPTEIQQKISEHIKGIAKIHKSIDYIAQFFKPKTTSARLQDYLKAIGLENINILTSELHTAQADTILTAMMADLTTKFMGSTAGKDILKELKVSKIKANEPLVAITRPTLKSYGVELFERMHDPNFIATDLLYSFEGARRVKYGEKEYILAKISQLMYDEHTKRGKRYGDKRIVDIRSKIFAFESAHELEEFLSTHFIKLPSVEANKSRNAYLTAAALKSRKKALDIFTHAIGLGKPSADFRKFDLIRSLMFGTKRYVEFKDSMYYYAQDVNFISYLRALDDEPIREYQKLAGKMSKIINEREKGRTIAPEVVEAQVELILARVHKELDVRLERLLQKDNITLHRPFLKLDERLGLRRIRTDSMEKAAADINIILSQLTKRIYGEKAETIPAGRMAKRLLLHASKEEVAEMLQRGAAESTARTVGDAVIESFVKKGKLTVGSKSILGSAIISSAGMQAFERFRKQFEATSGQLKKDSSDVGSLIAEALYKAKITTPEQYFAPKLNKQTFEKIKERALELAKMHESLEGNVSKLASKLKVQSIEYKSLLPYYRKALKFDRNEIAKDINYLFKYIQHSVGDNINVMMRVVHGGKNVQIGVLSERSIEAARTFVSGTAGDVIKPQRIYSAEANILNLIDIPIPGTEEVTVAGRKLSNMVFAQYPAELARKFNLLGTTEDLSRLSDAAIRRRLVKQGVIKEKDYYTLTDIMMSVYKDQTLWRNVKRKSYRMYEVAREYEQVIDYEAKRKLREEYLRLSREINTMFNMRRNEVVKLLSHVQSPERWLETIMGEHAIELASQTGSMSDVFKNTLIHYPDIASAFGTEKIKALIENVAETLKDKSNIGRLWGRVEKEIKGNVYPIDLSALFPYGRETNPQSPRIEQMLRHHMLETHEGGIKNVPYAETEYMREYKAIAKEVRKKHNLREAQSQMPMVVGLADVDDQLIRYIEKNYGYRPLGATTIESRAIVSSSVMERYTITDELHKTIANTIVHNVHGKPVERKVGDVIEHGALLGYTKEGQEIRFIHPFQEQAKYIGDYLMELTGDKRVVQRQLQGLKAGQARIAAIETMAGGTKRYKIEIPKPFIESIDLLVPGTKVTAEFIRKEHLADVLPGYMEMVMSPQELAKSSRLHPGTLMAGHVGYAVAALRDEEILRSRAKRMGLKDVDTAVKQMRAEAYETIKLFTGITKEKLDVTKPVLTPISLPKEEAKAAIEAASKMKLFQPIYNKELGLHIKELAFDFVVSSNIFFSRTRGMTPNIATTGVRFGHRELAFLVQQGYNEIAKHIMMEFDREAYRKGKYFKRAIDALAGKAKRPKGVEALRLEDFVPVESVTGKGYQKAGTILEAISKSGGWIKLPKEIMFNPYRTRSRGAGAGNLIELSEIYVPPVSMFKGKEGVYGEYVSIIGDLYKAMKSETPERDTLRAVERFSERVVADVFGKRSVLMKAQVADMPMSAVARAAPAVTGAPATIYMHPETFKAQFAGAGVSGEKALEVLKILQSRGEEMHMLAHRFPTAYAESTSAVAVRVATKESKLGPIAPGVVHIDLGSMALKHGDFDSDLLARIGLYNIKKEQWEKWDAKKIADEIERSQLHKEMKRFRAKRIEHVQAAERILRAKYRDTAESEQLKNLVSKYGLENVYESLHAKYSYIADEAIEKMSEQEFLKGISDLLEAKAGTKTWTGSLHNFATAVSSMGSEVWGGSKDMAAKMEAVTAFSGALSQSILSTKKTGAPPVEELLSILGSRKISTLPEAESWFVEALKKHGVYEDFIGVAGKHMLLSGVADTEEKIAELGRKAISGTFEMFRAYANMTGKSISVREYAASPAFKRAYKSEHSLKGISVMEAAEALEESNLGRTISGLLAHGTVGADPRKAVRQMEIGTATEAVTKAISGAANEAVKEVLDNSLARKVGIGAAVAIGAFGLFSMLPLGGGPGDSSSYGGAQKYMSGSTLSQYVYNDFMSSSGPPSYESMYIDVSAKSDGTAEDINKQALLAIRNTMPVAVKGEININDNRQQVHELVDRVLNRAIRRMV